MKLHAYVFCGCYEYGRVKRPPPGPEIISLHPNGDHFCFHPTAAQYLAYETWRLNACRHKYGTVTGGELGHRLPREVLYRAMLPHRRTFPLFVRKVLGCKPQIRFSYLTLKQVASLQLEPRPLQKFPLGRPQARQRAAILSRSVETTRACRPEISTAYRDVNACFYLSPNHTRFHLGLIQMRRTSRCFIRN
jgi:hypothetical protein